MKDVLIKYLLFVFPRRAYTAILGKFVRTSFSARLIPWYVRKFDIDTTDLDRSVQDYATLGQFFSRRLSSTARSISPEGICSPVDGVVSTCGQIVDHTMFQIKGQSYSLLHLFADDHSASRYQNGMYVTIYLSPRDYHRIHAPMDCTAVSCRHIPGTLFPVNHYGVTQIDQLFVRNERTVTEFCAEQGRFAVVKVGAAGVGTVVSPLIPHRSHRQRARGTIATYETSQRYRRGDEIGYFALGSTVLLIFSADSHAELYVKNGDMVKMGQDIGMLR